YAPMYPADIDLPNIISVAAVDGDNRLPHWTQYGAFNVDVAAPGVDIRSIDLANGRDSYRNVSGTSVSTAIASGVAALVKAKDLQDGLKALDAMDIKSILMTSSVPVTNAKGKLLSGGSINARKAIDFVEQPLIVIKNASWVEESRIENGVFDPFESGVLLLTIENLWQSANSVTLEVVEHDEKLKLTSKYFDLGSLRQKEATVARLPMQVSALSGHQRFYFKLKLSASTNANQVVTERDFYFESGALVDGEFVSSSLHEDAFDEYKYFHTSSPAGAENVVFELAYENAEYPMGLAVAHAQRPKIYYGMFGGEFYRLQGADRVRGSGYGVERISLPLGGFASYHLAVFGLPKSFSALVSEQSFQLRTCYTTQNNLNVLPVVDAGTDITLAVGSGLQLSGGAHDPDGDISLLWWDVVTGKDVVFENPRDPLTSVDFAGTGIYELRLNASDTFCGYKADTINVIVGDENDLNSGLQVLPPSYSAPLGGHVSTNVQGQIEGQFVDSLRLYSAPLGVEFDEQEHILRWSNVGPVGEHKIRFSATSKTSSEIQTGHLTIMVSDNNSNGDTFLGCSLRGGNSRDPIFILMLLFSAIFLLGRPRIGS
ncbi:MAG: S8 family serine peptidase, partial [Gammaproteobacteria bacterium]|nr:S8 family serine peptidase [Gammaproteobacteria bacterium]